MTMYLEHFGLREAPFRITPHTEFFFAGANRGATLEALVYAITAGEGLVKVTGEVGTGKTMLCRVLMERLPETVETIYLAVPSLTRDEMLIAIASELGIATQGSSTTQLLRGLQDRLVALHAEGRQVVALIDEAHAMPLATPTTPSSAFGTSPPRSFPWGGLLPPLMGELPTSGPSFGASRVVPRRWPVGAAYGSTSSCLRTPPYASNAPQRSTSRST